MTTRVSNPKFLTILNPSDPNLTRTYKVFSTADQEILQPFQATVSGNIAGLTDPVVRARQHIQSVLMTRAGERVMRPTYGAGLLHEVFEPINSAELVAISSRIKDSVSLFEQGVFIQDVSVKQSPEAPGAMEVRVTFRLKASPLVHQTVFDFAGNRLEI